MLTQTGRRRRCPRLTRWCRRVLRRRRGKAPRAARAGEAAARDSGRHWCGTREACSDLQAFAEGSGLPVACSFRFQDLFDNRHDHYVGDVGIGINPKLAERVRTADVLLVIGARLGEMTTGAYTAGRAAAAEGRSSCTCTPGAEELGRVYQGELLVNSGMPQSRPR